MGAIREEFGQLFSWEDHHRRLAARLAMVVLLTFAIDVFGTVAVYFAERHAAHTEITSLGDAAFFTTVQLLTVSSQLQNPFTVAGRLIDVVLELWAVIVVAGSAGALASFFQDASSK